MSFPAQSPGRSCLFEPLEPRLLLDGALPWQVEDAPGAALLGDPIERLTVDLADIGSGLTSPEGNFRWLDVADQAYSTAYQIGYDYTQGAVTVAFYTGATTFHGTVITSHLKPNFAYQFKIVGKPETDAAGNENIGLTGRWWQEEWDGSDWANGWNLNNKGDGSSPNPNDTLYFARRDLPDPTSPTGKRYRYTGYLVFDYFVTDENGDALFSFVADDSYHVLWKTTQRGHTADDGPVKNRTFDVTLPDPVGAYDATYPEASVDLFGEWERLPPGEVRLPSGSYTADLLLTEESFHGSGLAGGWAAAMGAEAAWTVTDIGLAPEAFDDVAAVAEDSADTLIDVLANDFDWSDDPIAVTQVGAAAHGTAALVGGQVLYTPGANYEGHDSFTYTITDDEALTSTATVTVVVNGANDPPDVVAPIPDVAAAEDDPDTVIDLAPYFADPDPGDALSYSVTISTPPSDLAHRVDEAGYTHVHQDLLYTHDGDNRGFGPEHDLARDNLFAWFQDLGFATSLEPFEYAGERYYNVVGTKPGATAPGDIYIVGAHYDSVHNPGADDNGSGTAAVMEIARAISQYEFDETLTLIAFDREEQGVRGSAAYAAAHAGDHILGMVNLDMIAYNPDGGGQNKVRLYDAVAGGNIKADLIAAFAAYGNGVVAVDSGRTDRSDHAPFEDHGFDAALVIEHEAGSNPYYHDDADAVETPGYIDYAYATKVTGAIAGYIGTVASLTGQTGLLTATVNGNLLTLDYADNQNGAVTITARATDRAGLYVEDTFTVTASPAADLPVLTDPLPDVTVPRYAPDTVIDLAGHFNDADILPNGDWLAYTIEGNTNEPLVATQIENETLTLEYAFGPVGAADVTVRATDADGTSVEDTFHVDVDGSLPLPDVRILDDGRSGFQLTGDWVGVSRRGYLGDLHYSAAGDGSDAATWTFADLTPGSYYRVSATWLAKSNRATDAPFSVLDGATPLATVRVNQEHAPDDFSDAEADWEDLGGPFQVTGDTLVVRLSDDANQYVIADAVRIELGEQPPPPPPMVDDGDPGFTMTGDWTTVDGIPAFQGDHVYSAKGDGADTATWTVTGLTPGEWYRVSATWLPKSNRATDAPYRVLDGGVEVATARVNQENAPDDLSDLWGDWEYISGPIQVTGDTLVVELSDDANQYVIADAVRVDPTDEPPPSTIIDDGDAGFTTAGDWTVVSGIPAFQGDHAYSAAGDGSDRATWTFGGLTPGTWYRVSATWLAKSNRATDAPYRILDGAVELATVDVNQENAPSDFSSDGTWWKDLDGPYQVTGDTLAVELSDDADQYVIADAIRIEETVAPPERTILDDGDAGFGTVGRWTYVDGIPAHQGDHYYSAAGDGSDVTSWTFGGLTAGATYKVSATWLAKTNRATDAPFSIYDGITLLDTVDLDQTDAPDDFTDAGASWEDVGTFTLTGETLIVRLTDDANGYVIADAIRLELVS